jgi:glycosyltransferase involved in cell wall biosynthesis
MFAWSPDIPSSAAFASDRISAYPGVQPALPSVTPRPSSDVQVALLAEAGGGVMRHVIDLHRGLIERNWRSTLIISPKRMDERYLAEINSFDKDQVVFIDMARAPHHSDVSAYVRVNAVLNRMGGRRILHAHSTKAGLLGSLLSPEGVAMTYTPHAYRATDPSLSSLTRLALREVEMAYSRAYDRIIAVSGSEREYVLSCGVDPARVTCIPNGVHYKANDADVLRPQRSKLPEPITLGFVGRLAHQKNPLLFVETLACLVQRGCDAKAIVVGDGELRSDMMAHAEHLDVSGRIDWRGDMSASEALHEMDIMVHTSRYEALPYTLLEACACLLRVVATDNHGSRSVLQGELAGNIVAEAKPHALTERILQLVRNKSLWLRQLDLLDAAAHEFSLDRMVGKVEQVYLDLLTTRPELSRGMRNYLAPAVSRIQPFA